MEEILEEENEKLERKRKTSALLAGAAIVLCLLSYCAGRASVPVKDPASAEVPVQVMQTEPAKAAIPEASSDTDGIVLTEELRLIMRGASVAQYLLDDGPVSLNEIIAAMKSVDIPDRVIRCVSSAMKTDWNEQALLAAQRKLKAENLSYSGLVGYLLGRQFTPEEALHGADNARTGWPADEVAYIKAAVADGLNLEAIPTQPEETQPPVTVGQQNALRKARSYLSHTAFSYKRLIEQLEFEGFTHDEAVYGVDNCGADWMEQAVKCAERYLSHTAFSRVRLIEQLEFEGFTHEQAVYGVEQNGL